MTRKKTGVVPAWLLSNWWIDSDGDAIVVTDVDVQVMNSSVLSLPKNERQLMTSGGLGNNFGIPAAIGTIIANGNGICSLGMIGSKWPTRLAILNIWVPIKGELNLIIPREWFAKWRNPFYEGEHLSPVFDTLLFQLMAQTMVLKAISLTIWTLAQDEVITEDVPVLIGKIFLTEQSVTNSTGW